MTDSTFTRENRHAATLIAKVAETTGMTKKDVEIAWKALQQTVADELKGGEEVTLTGVGKLKPTVRAARTGRNPHTGQEIAIPEKQTVSLKVSSTYAG